MKPIFSGLFVLALFLQSSSSLAGERSLSEKTAEVCAAAAFRSNARCMDDKAPTFARLRKIQDILTRFKAIGDEVEGCTKISELDRNRCLQD